jgi:hypothetical protein
MLRRLSHFLFFSLLILFFAGSGYPAKNKTSCTLQFKHLVGTTPLQLDSGVYSNRWQQKFVISKFKYYLSNFSFITAKGNSYSTDNCYLLNEEDSASKKITIRLPAADYRFVVFDFGIDSLRNSNGINEGTLDPVNGMYWSWNSGYIFLKLEGSSPSSSAAGHQFEYHVGGYKYPNNCRRRIQLPLSSVNHCAIEVDILALLNSAVIGGFHKTPAVSDPLHSAPLADACSALFKSL